ncbi:MAG: hypothetical protein CMB74_07300 [Euryarchaeota archaeon]|nr:hypothetical protein [Euryarchaeota archaeon]
MNITVACDESYRTFELIGELPEPLSGVHQNPRSLNYAGAWNAAVDLLIARRFILQLHSIQFQFEANECSMRLADFLNAGGFDEALDSASECRSECWLRSYEANGDDERYSEQMTTILSLSMSQNLRKKMDLRRGILPVNGALSPPLNSSTPATTKGAPETNEITLCVTFGDLRLGTQFFQSLSKHAPEGIDLHLVACCFQVSPDEIEALLTKHPSLLKSHTILPESWGHGQGREGKMGPWYADESHRRGVSWGRCVLHRAAALFSPTEAMWILDDDVKFSQASLRDVLHEFDTMKSDGRKVGIGAVLGDAPIPPSYMVRTQTIDFYYAHFLSGNDQVASVPQEMLFHDMHHDLSTEKTYHLEYPLGLDKAYNHGGFNTGVLHGKSLTRAVHSNWKNRSQLLARGGNTLVLGNEVLLQFPNMAPNLGGIMCRRGDTLWTKRIQTEHPEWIGNANIALEQRRHEDFHFGTRNGVRGDILGSMLVRLHDCPDLSRDEMYDFVLLREARLISNLMRTMTLLRLLLVDEAEQRPLARLLDELEQTPWPEDLSDHLASFIKTYPLDVVKFQQAQGA